MKKIWIFTELFYPEETSTAFILTKIANKLANKYDIINVVCANKLDENKNQENLSSKIKVKRLTTFFNNKNSLIARFYKFIELSVKFLFVLLFKVKSKEKIFLVTNPAPLIVIVSLIKRIKKLNVVLLVHDVFPENTISANIIKDEKSIYYKIIKFIFDKSYQNISKIIVLGRDMKEVVSKKTRNSKTEIVIIENWGESDKIFPKPNTNEKIVFQYAGNIGRVQGLYTLMEIITHVKNEGLLFEFIGNGAEKKSLIDFAKKNKLKNVIFKNSFGRDEQNDILNMADVAIISLSKGMYGLGVPSKFYNILSSGKPILYIGEENTEIHLVMKDNDIGYFFNINDKKGLVNFFNQFNKDDEFIIKGKNSRELLLNNYTEEIILEKYLNEI